MSRFQSEIEDFDAPLAADCYGDDELDALIEQYLPARQQRPNTGILPIPVRRLMSLRASYNH